jgi:hypothetical protein
MEYQNENSLTPGSKQPARNWADTREANRQGCSGVSKLHACIEDLIWRLVNLKFEDGRVLTERMDISRLIPIARVLSRRYLKEPILQDVINALLRADEIREDRNFIVHGTWCTVFPEGIAYSASLRSKSEPGEATAEEFPHHRMRRIVSEIIRVKRVIVKAYDGLP